MRISGVGYSPYVYNANAVSRASMEPIESIEEDVLSSGVDYSGLSKENENPLRMGETRNFADIIASQMAMSARNAGRVMNAEDTSSYMQGQDDSPMAADTTDFLESMDELTADDMQMVTKDMDEDSTVDKNAETAAEGSVTEQNQIPVMEKMEPVTNVGTDGYSDQISLYQRMHASQAYENMMAS